MSKFQESNPYSGPSKERGPTKGSTNCGLATASLILGLLTPFCFSFLAGIPALILGVIALQKISRSGGQLKGQGMAITGVVTGGAGTLFSCMLMLLPALLLPAVQSAREAARQQVSLNNMKQIGLAMHNHYDIHGALPAAGSVDGDSATGLGLSWRVHLLPFLDQSALYDQFHLDEPWDSPHNKSLLPMMPELYQSPNMPRGEVTLYMGVVQRNQEFPGARTLFGDGTQSRKLSEVTDGSSDTIMIVEADIQEAVLWTKPADLELDTSNPSRGLGTLRFARFLALMVDGGARPIPNETSAAELLNLLLMDDGK